MKELEQLCAEVADRLIKNQVDLDPDFAKVLNENFWKLLNCDEPPTVDHQ
jgi:hypothetical protein